MDILSSHFPQYATKLRKFFLRYRRASPARIVDTKYTTMPVSETRLLLRVICYYTFFTFRRVFRA